MVIAELIQKSPLFRGCDKQDLQEVMDESQIRKISKGQQLFAIGDKANSLFIIAEGWIKLYRISRTGEEAIINIFGPNETFAEAAVFSERQTYPVNAQAIDDAELVSIPRGFFLRKISEDSNFALAMLGTISARQHFLVQQVEQMATRTAPQRIGAFLLRFSRPNKERGGGMTVTLPYDKSIISTRLNIKPETFSRALAKLAPCGVSIQGREIDISSPEALAEFCDIAESERLC